MSIMIKIIHVKTTDSYTPTRKFFYNKQFIYKKFYYYNLTINIDYNLFNDKIKCFKKKKTAIEKLFIKYEYKMR